MEPIFPPSFWAAGIAYVLGGILVAWEYMHTLDGRATVRHALFSSSIGLSVLWLTCYLILAREVDGWPLTMFTVPVFATLSARVAFFFCRLVDDDFFLDAMKTSSVAIILVGYIPQLLLLARELE